MMPVRFVPSLASLLLLGFLSCARPAASSEQLSRLPVAGVAPPPPAVRVDDETRARVRESAGRARVDDALYLPPEGRVLHGMGPWDQGNRRYLAALAAPELMPASQLTYLKIGDGPRPWSFRRKGIAAFLDRQVEAGRIPHLDIELRDRDEANFRALADPLYGIDDEFVATDRYDHVVVDIARLVGSVPMPVFVRIGGEFNGAWNGYHPYDYPRAFRKVVEIFRREGADNAAFIWCYEPAAPDDFAEVDGGRPRWYPGDDVVDWFALDLFDTSDFSGPLSRSGRATKHGRSVAFVEMAARHGKPMMIAAASAAKVDITRSPADGERVWDEWFAPFFAFIERHESIRAFYYVNNDWRRNANYRGRWGQADLSINPVIVERYVAELRDPKYLHRDELPLVSDWDWALQRELTPRPSLEPTKEDVDDVRRLRRDGRGGR